FTLSRQPERDELRVRAGHRGARSAHHAVRAARDIVILVFRPVYPAPAFHPCVLSTVGLPSCRQTPDAKGGDVRRLLGAAILVAHASVGAASAQTVTATMGAIDGRVTDNTNAVLPGVTVTIGGPAMMGTRIATTNDEGVYR